jgi:hypothetical protein
VRRLDSWTHVAYDERGLVVLINEVFRPVNRGDQQIDWDETHRRSRYEANVEIHRLKILVRRQSELAKDSRNLARDIQTIFSTSRRVRQKPVPTTGHRHGAR